MTKKNGKPTAEIIVGKDLLEFFSSAMYVNPLTIYREYIQNSCDAIDDAVKDGLFTHPSEASVTLTADSKTRSVIIRDTGAGICTRDALQILTAFGNSKKRGTSARGFRGVGRLGGLGYCKELIFRTKKKGEKSETEVRWDCVKLKETLLDSNAGIELQEIVGDCVSSRLSSSQRFGEHFFEIELRGVVRIRNDVLLNTEAIRTYLSQVAPVPYHSGFIFADQIKSVLLERGIATYRIFLNDSPDFVVRPHETKFKYSESITDEFTDFSTFTVTDEDLGVDAFGWFLHHGYYGALPGALNIKGLRVRKGNIQIGGLNLLEGIFPQSRFNSWVVGEVHVRSKKLIPNGRRDNFEQNFAYLNFESRMMDHGRKIAQLCRERSQKRSNDSKKAQCTPVPESVASILEEEQLAFIDRQPFSTRKAYLDCATIICAEFKAKRRKQEILRKLLK